MAQMLERYVYKNQKKMRCGYTTGTCAAAAAKAAAQMLLSGRKVTEVSVRTPSDITLTLPVCEIQMKAHAVSCAVQKDSGLFSYSPCCIFLRNLAGVQPLI